jgi:hypothetical protein
VKLPAGASGFVDSQPGTGGTREFLAACHAAARQTGATVAATQQAAVTPDFDAVLLAYEHENVAALRHTLLSLVAFVRVPGDHIAPPLEFTDRFPLAQILSAVGYQVLPAAELRQPLTSADLSDLSAHEHEQIRYWKPQTVGELLFNYWD